MLLAHHLWEHTPDGAVAGAEQWQAALESVFAEQDDALRATWDSLEVKERAVFTALALGEPVFGARTLARFNLSKGGAQHAREALAHAGHIQQVGRTLAAGRPPLGALGRGIATQWGRGSLLMTARRRLVRVPASSANLGPGYDAMAAAVALHLELEVEETGEYGFETGGLDVPTGRDNLLVRAFETLHPADGITFRLRSEIPLARGLGSSAAAIVAGLVAADHLFELALTREELLARATEIEGHPDNVAAAIYGGFVVCAPAARRVPGESLGRTEFSRRASILRRAWRGSS